MITDKSGSTHRELYDYLRAKLAPDTKTSYGKLTATSSIQTALGGLLITVVLGGTLTYLAAVSDGNLQQTGRHRGSKMALEAIVTTLGVGGVLLISLLVAAGFVTWIIHRVNHPLPAEMVVVSDD